MSTEILLDELFLLRYPDLVARRIFTNRMSLRRAMQRELDPFPKPLRLGTNSIAWRADQVAAWLNRRAAQPNEAA